MIEFELESDAVAFEENRVTFVSEMENGGCVRFGNIVVYGNSPMIAELESGEVTEKGALTVDIIVDAIKTNSNLTPQHCDKAARSEHEADFIPRITLYETVEFYTAEDKWIVVYRAENEADAIVAEESRALMVDERYGSDGRCVRYGTIVIYGNMDLISTLDFSFYELPEDAEPESYEAEPDLVSVKGIVATLESKAPLGARYFDERYFERMENRYQVEGEITDMAHLTHVGTGSDWIDVYEFSLESDAIAFESARADEIAQYENGGCVRFGNIVVYGDSSALAELG